MEKNTRLAQLDHMARALDRVLQAEITGDWLRLQEAMADVRQAVIDFGTTLAPGSHETAAVVDRFVDEVYPKLEAAYRVAGAPCGPDEEGLWCWLRQHAAIAAEAERVARERAWQRGLEELRHEVARRRLGRAGGARTRAEAADGDDRPPPAPAVSAGGAGGGAGAARGAADERTV
jgi:hypothetical protein